jgi:RNA polymerase sigma-70 factor (ECF subfamily)
MTDETHGSEATHNRDDPAPANSHDEAPELINRIVRGDVDALAELFSQYRPRLWRMINFRLHPRLRGRVDPDDVLQEAWLKAVTRISYFLRGAAHSSFIWFRMITQQSLIELHRRHLGAEKRNASRELSLEGHWSSESTSSSLAFHLLGAMSSPSSALHRAELANQLDVALQGMDEIDREVLALRHFEELSNRETAKVLEMSEQAASARYNRALRRLRQIVELLPGLTTPSE